MAGLSKRPGTASWMAILTDTADSRKQCRKSTFVRVRQEGKKEAQTRKEAQAVADGYEAVYRGRILYREQADIFRRQAGTTADEQKALGKRLDILRELGTARRMPTIREYFTTFTPKGKDQNVRNSRRAYARFLEYLGRNADKRLDCLTREHIQAFVDSEGLRVRPTTIGQYRTHISTALNAAINAELLVRNPAHGVSIAPDAEEPIRREAFTTAEIAKNLSQRAPRMERHRAFLRLHLRAADRGLHHRRLDTRADLCYKRAASSVTHVRSVPPPHKHGRWFTKQIVFAEEAL